MGKRFMKFRKSLLFIVCICNVLLILAADKSANMQNTCHGAGKMGQVWAG